MIATRLENSNQELELADVVSKLQAVEQQTQHITEQALVACHSGSDVGNVAFLVAVPADLLGGWAATVTCNQCLHSDVLGLLVNFLKLTYHICKFQLLIAVFQQSGNHIEFF